MNDNEKYIEEFVNDIPFDTPDDEHRDELKKQLLHAFPKHRLQPTVQTVNVWRKIMKSSITKLAAAAVIIVAVLIAFHSFGSGTITFAQVVEPIITAKTIVLDMLVSDEATSPIMHEIIVGSQIRRTVSNVPDVTQILDLENAKMLALDDKERTAVYVDIGGHLHEGTRIYINFLRNVVVELKDNPNIEKLPEREINGKKTVGFVSRSPNEEVKIWADPETALPIRIELRVGQFFAIMKNLQFNVQIDDSLVSMEVPPGYKLHQAEFDLTGATEKDFIEGLRIWARIYDGSFPDAIGTEVAMKQAPMLAEKLDQLGLPEEETGQLMMTYVRGMLFLQLLEVQSKFQYSGNGVKLGDAGTAIFWYQPKGSETYRIIYGDLSVKDVAQENLPE